MGVASEKRSAAVLVAWMAALGAWAATAGPAEAQPAGASVSEEELRRQLELRDAVILELLRRVEELERSAGVEPAPPAAMPTEDEAPVIPSQRPPAPEPARPAAESAESEQPPRQPGRLEVDEEAAERALERALVETGALLLPAGTMEVAPQLSYVRREEDRPGSLALSLDRTGFVAAEDLIRSNEIEAGVTLRLGLPYDFQFDFEIPHRYEDVSRVARVSGAGLEEDTTSASGLGDVRLTLRHAVLEEGAWWPNLFASAAWDTDTGETDGGQPLGSGFHELSFGLTATKRQDPLVFTASVAYTAAFEEDGIDPGDEIGLSAGAVLAVSPETSLRFAPRIAFRDEFEVDGRAVPGSDRTVGVFTAGASTVLGRGVLLDLSTDIGLTEDAPDFGVFLSLPIRFDTGLF